MVLPIVLGNPDRGIGPALASGWLSEVDVLLLPPVLIRRGTMNWAKRVDEDAFVARFGRNPLESEIGCAAAHLSAYEALLDSTYAWALIFEDDAVVLDSEELLNITTAIVEHFGERSGVWSLYSEGTLFPEELISVGRVTHLRLRLSPQGAVAYLVDRATAASLLSAQTPISNVSDWPLNASHVQFWFVPNRALTHLSNEATSTVAPEVDRGTLVSTPTKLLMWSGLWYLAHKRYFRSFREYCYQVMRPRLANRFWRGGIRASKGLDSPMGCK